MAGVGIGLRRELFDSLPRTARRLDWVEITPENFFDGSQRALTALEACRARWPVVAHGVALNLGGLDPVSEEYLANLRGLLGRHELSGYSDHLCFAIAGGRNFADLLPLPHTQEAAAWVAARVRQVQDHLGRQMLLENISAYARAPGGDLTEGQFLTAVVQLSGAGLLLDINNVFVTSHNLGQDPVALLESLPLEKTGEIHLAGHKIKGPLRVDDHGSQVCDEVWQLLRRALRKTGPVPLLIEWDTNVPEVDVILDEADKARAILRELQ